MRNLPTKTPETLSVSFCTASMDRLHHVRQTLPQNIKDNADYPSLEFVLLDYSSSDGLEEWVKASMREHIESGLLVYARISGRTEFGMAHSKNLSHRLAQGDVVCNVDADNFTGPGFAWFLNGLFGTAPHALARAHPLNTAGRIALLKKYFIALGGYDESFTYGWGYDDTDMEYRAVKFGLEHVDISRHTEFLSHIEHGDSDRIGHSREKDKWKSNDMHRLISEKNLQEGIYTANAGKKWGSGNVTVNFTENRPL